MYTAELKTSNLWGSTLLLHRLTQTLAHYRNALHLATTTGSEVWRADDGDQRVVIKIAHFDYEWTIKSEVEWLNRLRGCRNIVQILRSDPDGQFLIEDFLRGQRLDDLRIGEGELRESLIAEILRQLLIGLAGVHYEGGVHTDLGPRNVMLASCGRVTIFDLGLCASINSALTKCQGTPRYTAPEGFACEGLPATKLADYYSVAALAEKLFTELPGEQIVNWTDAFTESDELTAYQQVHPVEIPWSAPTWLEYLIAGFGGVRAEDRWGDTAKLRGYLFDAGRAARNNMSIAMSLVEAVNPIDEISEGPQNHDGGTVVAPQAIEPTRRLLSIS